MTPEERRELWRQLERARSFAKLEPEPRHDTMCRVDEAQLDLLARVHAVWRVADSIVKLFEQVNLLAPDRDRTSDGTICDSLHSPDSDHCPHDIPGLGSDVVTAGDFDHDPGAGADMGEISEALRKSRDPRIAYVIFNRRIFSATIQPWVWRTYAGSSPHTGHMHVSVVHHAIADSTLPWEIDMSLTTEDIRRVSDATAAKVLGRSWSIAGRTLAGSVEALLNFHGIVMGVLTELRDDPDNTWNPTDGEMQLIADRLAQRLPSGGTFILDGPGMPA